MSAMAQQILGVVLIGVACVLVPVAGIRMLAPELSASRFSVVNYRGRAVSPSLGIVWVLWVGGLVVVLLGTAVATSVGTDLLAADRSLADVFGILATAAIAVVAAFVFGMIDDVFGGAGSKGFKGHLRALAHGRVTTGLLKLVGIGTASLLVGGSIAVGASGEVPVVGTAARALVIALAANTLNLFDLRPGRALKVYGVIAALVVVTVPLTWRVVDTSWVPAALALALALTGPLMAVWRYDVRELAMLGDAGANPAGALLGAMIAALWPLWAIVAAAAVFLGINVLSERVSFSSAIEGNAMLAWMDRLGRRASIGDDSPTH